MGVKYHIECKSRLTGGKWSPAWLPGLTGEFDNLEDAICRTLLVLGGDDPWHTEYAVVYEGGRCLVHQPVMVGDLLYFSDDRPLVVPRNTLLQNCAFPKLHVRWDELVDRVREAADPALDTIINRGNPDTVEVHFHTPGVRRVVCWVRYKEHCDGDHRVKVSYELDPTPEHAPALERLARVLGALQGDSNSCQVQSVRHPNCQ